MGTAANDTAAAPPAAPLRVLNAFWGYDDPDIIVIEQVPGGIQRRAVRAELASYVPKEHVTRDLMRNLRNARSITGLAMQGDWLCIHWKREQQRRDANTPKDGWFAKQEIPTFESDVNPVRRWLTDNENVEIARPRRCYLDLETCGRHPLTQKELHRVLLWSVVADDGSFKQGILNSDTDADERALLHQLWEHLDNFDQVCAWNGERFDFPVLVARTKARRLQVEHRRWLWLDHLELYRRMNVSASESGDEKQSLALQSVAMAVLGQGKLEGFKGGEFFAAWADPALRERLAAYNLHDAELMRLIEAKTGYIELLFTLCRAVGTFPDSRGSSPMEQVEAYMLRLGRRRGFRFPQRNPTGANLEAVNEFAEQAREAAGFSGAFVLEPRGNGVQRNVHVCDFSAMYPSIIQSLNISPETVVEQPSTMASTLPLYMQRRELAAPKPPPPYCAVGQGTGVWFDQRARGLLPEALDELIRLRKEWAAKKEAATPGTPEWVDADRRSTAYKIAANGFFGVVGAQMSRLYAREVAESITLTGVALIRATLTAAEQQGLVVVYGDTDSLFVKGCSKARFEEFVAWCNKELYPDLLRRWGAQRNTVKLAYEKQFDRIVFVKAKRYAGRYAHYKGKAADARSKPEVKGLEYKRGDSSKLARRLQAEVIDGLLGGGVLGPRVEECQEEPEYFQALIERWREAILQKPLALEDVMVSKRLSRPLKEYASKLKADGTEGALPPHVRIAKILRERGEDVGEGSRIEYVVVDGTAKPAGIIPAADWTGECDRYHLWEDAVWPPTERVLLAALPQVDWKMYGRARPRRGEAGAGQLGLLGVVAIPRRTGAAATARAQQQRAAAAGQGALFGLDDK